MDGEADREADNSLFLEWSDMWNGVWNDCLETVSSASYIGDLSGDGGKGGAEEEVKL